MSPGHEELTRPAKSCTAAGSNALHAAHEVRGDGIGKREKVAWVARDWQDKGRGLLDVAQETYKLTACTTIKEQWSYPQFLRSLKSKRLSIGSEFLLKFFLIFVVFCVAFVFALHLHYSLRTASLLHLHFASLCLFSCCLLCSDSSTLVTSFATSIELLSSASYLWATSHAAVSQLICWKLCPVA